MRARSERGGVGPSRGGSTLFAAALLPVALGLAVVSAGAQATPTGTSQTSGAQSASSAASPLVTTPPRLEVDGPLDSKIRLEVYDRFRGEFVDWFATANPGPTPRFRYNFLGNKLQLGLRVTRAPWELFVQFQNTTLGNVPSNATGIGSTYYANTRSSTQNGAFLRNGYLANSKLFGVDGLSIKGGRQLYSNGLEANVKDPSLRWIQVNRFSQRLIGPFEYTHVGRSFDGGVVSWASPKIALTGFGFRPTYGGFEVDANRQLDIDLAGGAISLPDSPELGTTFGQLVWIYYHDYRDVTYLDNRPLAVRQAATGRSATLHTVGANAAHIFGGVGPGAIDAVAYGFGQMGDYQGQSSGAWAYGAETGYRFTEAWAKPWFRLGINSASGDPDPNDDKHQTFFQMLPTAWLYAQFPFYNMMNNQDVFVQAIVEPESRVSLRLDFHWLRVNSNQDLAYFGGGATKNDFFGFGGVPAQGRYELAYLVHTMLTLKPLPWLTLNAFYGHAFGQGVIEANYTGKQGNYGFAETIVAF